MQVTPKLAILSSTGHAGYYRGGLFNGPVHWLGPLFSFFVVYPLFHSPSQAVTTPRPLLTQNVLASQSHEAHMEGMPSLKRKRH